MDHEATLEDVIALSGGDARKICRVERGGRESGALDRRALVGALVGALVRALVRGPSAKDASAAG